ncbi:winged helix-turn-helix transcriptional regulator [Streptomyces sp. NPDC087420]|uniref:winged helix-turn-helix transcriptional regulator n=1 Tax=Streptomyces sp. NPDC087420 TaxID=3365785 RepID=UPI0038350FA9
MPHPSNEPSCSIERSLGLLGERWTLLILRGIYSGCYRFSELQATLDIASNLLSTRLKTLEAGGVIRKLDYQMPAGSRRRASYHLTPAGEELRLILAAFQQWGDDNCPRPSGPSAFRRQRSTGQAVHVGFIDDEGREVAVSDVHFVAAPES